MRSYFALLGMESDHRILFENACQKLPLTESIYFIKGIRINVEQMGEINIKRVIVLEKMLWLSSTHRTGLIQTAYERLKCIDSRMVCLQIDVLGAWYFYSVDFVQ
jgi:hypothetical protein